MAEGRKNGVALLVGAGDGLAQQWRGDSPLEVTLCA
jgi:hypothetical protein